MKRICFLILLFVSVFAHAQQKECLFTIQGGDSVYTDEFMRSFTQNNNNDYSQSAMQEYLNLYINYKLKLLDAKKEGLYEDHDINSQVEDFRNSLFQPKINDPHILDSLTKQAYDRQKTWIRASHCLIKIPADASLAEIQALKEKAEMVFDKAKKGADFDSLVMIYSDDPSATSPTLPNFGDLGYFTSMTMVYPFEEACYDMVEKGLQYGLAKTRFGWHIIKITDVKQTDIFTITLRHLFISTQSHSDSVAKDMIYNAYGQLSTVSLDSLAKLYSDDKGSLQHGGMLTQQRPNQLPAEYVSKILSMEKGEVSEPFKTRFGWHIIRFLNSVPIPEWEFQRNEIKERIMRDERSQLSTQHYIESVKQDMDFTVDSSAVMTLSKVVTDSVFNATWQKPENMPNFNKTIIYFGDTALVQRDLLNYIYENQFKQPRKDIMVYLFDVLNAYSDQSILKYCKDHMADNDPKLQQTIRDYQEGEIIFAITDKRVWSKSLSDSIGLNEFYEQHKNRYMYTKRADAVLWKVDTSLNAEKIAKKIAKYKKHGKSDDEIKDILNTKYNAKATYHWSKFEKGADNIIDKNIFETNVQKTSTCYIDKSSVKNRHCIIYLNEILTPSVKPLSACKGLCTSDYQALLEKNWIDDLRKEYNVVVDESVFKELIKRYE